jgi:hypothetical protein
MHGDHVQALDLAERAAVVRLHREDTVRPARQDRILGRLDGCVLRAAWLGEFDGGDTSHEVERAEAREPIAGRADRDAIEPTRRAVIGVTLGLERMQVGRFEGQIELIDDRGDMRLLTTMSRLGRERRLGGREASHEIPGPVAPLSVNSTQTATGSAPGVRA